MISDLIVSFIDFMTGIVDKNFPTFELSDSASNVPTAISTLVDFVKVANFILPLSDMAIILGIVVGIEVFKMALFIINWVLRRFLDVVP